MATRDFYLTLGTNLIDAVGSNWQIAGIVIDNPSGSWLQVSGVNQFVPPYVSGWSYPILPEQSRISVTFVDSPSGSLSQLVGGQPHVVITDQVVPSSAGFTSGAGARVSTVPPFRFTQTPLVAKTIAGALPVIVLIAFKPIIIRGISALYEHDASNLQAQYGPPSANVAIFWEGKLGGGLFALWQAISPEMPYVREVIEDGAVYLPLGAVLEATGIVEEDGADQGVTAQVQYYEEA